MAEDSPIASPKESGQKSTTIRELPRGTVTLLFTDIEGSTLLLQQLGERYSSVLSEYRDLLRTAFSEHDGHEVDTQGDGFFVVFVRARDAMLATVAAQRALTTHSWPEGAVVRVRMGLHTGEPSLVGESYVGLDVHYTARIMRAAHGGQVLLSQTTHDLIENEFPFGVSLRDLGKHRLKDLQCAAHLYQLVIVGLSADFPPLKALDRCPNNLPFQLTALIGREKEVAAVQYLLQREDVRLVTLTGPGGAGKTRLGLQVVAELSDLFPDGVFFVNLAPLSDPELVVPTIAQTLDIKEIAGQTLLDLLKAYLRWKHLLLLLDNFEQVIDAAVYVAELLAACPLLKVMVSSRAALHVRGEQQFAVPPLAVPDPKQLPDLVTLSQYEAVRLFIQRAQAVKPDLHLTNANAPIIAEICVRLDGLPLAIELAAARIRVLPPQALLTRLSQRLAVLTGGPPDTPARHQTLRNTIAWSYSLLTAQEQQLFRRLSVFVAGCTLEAIEAVCTTLDTESASLQVLDGVTSLIDKSMLQQMEQGSNELRLVMLETIREYGLEVLSAHDEKEMTQRAHADYYLRLSEEADLELAGSQQVVWLERLEQEHDNLRAALGWFLERGEAGQSMEMALRLAAALWRFWEYHSHWSEGQTFLERALAGSKGVEGPVQMKVLKAAAHIAFVRSDFDRAEALSQESLARCRELGDTAGIALSLRILGAIAELQSNFGVAYSLAEESLALFKEVGDKEGIGWSLQNLAGLVSLQGEYARAISLREEGLALFREVGNIEGIAFLLDGLAVLLILSQGDQETGRALLEESLARCREVGHKEGIAGALGLLGQVTLLQGDAVKARSLLEESVALAREIGKRSMAWAFIVLARVVACQGDYLAARAFYEESLTFSTEIEPSLLPPYLEGLADRFVIQGDPAWAARLWGLAEAQRAAMGIPISPVERVSYALSVSAARAQLGVEIFASAWAEGGTMTPEQALTAPGPVTLPHPFPAALSMSSPAKPSRTSPGGLSARELEVLRLLATGLTDAQIAEQLVLSLHTVHAHLRTIYSKVGVTSRSAATRYAFEHQLM